MRSRRTTSKRHEGGQVLVGDSGVQDAVDVEPALPGRKVSVDDKAVKPAREMKVGEVIEVRKGAVRFRYEVLSFPRAGSGRPSSRTTLAT